MQSGQIVKSGGSDLAKELEAQGYDWVAKEFASSGAN
jgi:Fe-S cluster assembly ATPase SufC